MKSNHCVLLVVFAVSLCIECHIERNALHREGVNKCLQVCWLMCSSLFNSGMPVPPWLSSIPETDRARSNSWAGTVSVYALEGVKVYVTIMTTWPLIGETVNVRCC